MTCPRCELDEQVERHIIARAILGLAEVTLQPAGADYRARKVRLIAEELARHFSRDSDTS